MMILYSTAALAAGFMLDLILGDPPCFPHIVRGMGRLIASLEKALRKLTKTSQGEFYAGTALVFTVIIICFILPFAILRAAYILLPMLGFALEALLCWQLLAARSLRDESMRVYKSLETGDILNARKDVSRIVGRDTEVLDFCGVTRAAVETVAENTSDGVIAPLFYIMIGGAALGGLYKAVNTMDSMIGYKNERYLYFGRTAAKLDDMLNYLPARLAALLMVVSCPILRLDTRGAFKMWKRDRRKHASPNSAQTESVCAGALGIQLAGPVSYFGVYSEKPYIGDEKRLIVPADIANANRLLYAASVMMLVAAIAVRGVVYAVL